MSRLPPIDEDKLSPEQKRVYDQIAGKRKTVRGPFPMWLRNPTTNKTGERTIVKVGEGKKDLILDLPVPPDSPR